jgi:hypothetical protein
MYTMVMYNALVEAIATGTREVWYGDKRVAYRSLDEMLRIKDDMETYLGIGGKNPKRVLASFSKGTTRF